MALVQHHLESRQVRRTSVKATPPARRWLPALALPVAMVGLTIVFWELLVRSGRFQAFILPPPGTVFSRLAEMLRDGTLTTAAAVTLEEAMGGLAIAIVIALPLGYALARVPSLEQFFSPLLAASQAIPVIAVAPLLVLWLDTGLVLKVTVSAVIVMFPLLVNSVVGIRGVPREYIEVAKVFGAPWWERVFRVELPLAAPVLLAGIKLGVALSLTGAIVGEFVAADQGLGFLLNYYRENLYTAELFATLILLAAIGIALFSVVTYFERIVARWQG